MQESGQREDKIRISVRACELLLVLKITRVYRNNGRVFLAWVVDGPLVVEWCLGLEQMVRSNRKRDPFVISGD